jgi:hypothetical protein
LQQQQRQQKSKKPRFSLNYYWPDDSTNGSTGIGRPVAKGNRAAAKNENGEGGRCFPSHPFLPLGSCSSFGFLSASSRHYRNTVLQTKEEEEECWMGWVSR